MKEQLIKHIVSSLTSKKFIVVMFSLACLFGLLLIVILRSCPIQEGVVNALLMALGSVFAAYCGANVAGDHFGKTTNPKIEDSKPAVEETKPIIISEETKK
jgi:hypothetical protein